MPDMELGGLLGSEGNGVSMGKGGKGGPGPPERGKDKQSISNKGRKQGKGREGPPKSDVMKEDWRERSEQTSNQVNL